jgi:hypothetical protein
MKFKTLMIIKAVVCLGFGVLLLAVPEFVYGLFGASLAAGGAYAAREYGAALIGIMLITWFARNAGESDARWAIILGLCVYDAIGFVATLAFVLAGVLNALAWLVVALYLFLAIAFGYFLVRSPEEAAVRPKLA